MPTEADTCCTFVLPKLYAAGWNDDQIAEQRTFTAGRILVNGRVAQRGKPKRADYLLHYNPSLSAARHPRPSVPLGVVILGISQDPSKKQRQIDMSLTRQGNRQDN